MNYIVFDLEWNQCPYGKKRENSELPFEIIEIGAVKLNKDLEVVDRFYKVIKPSVYHSLHYRTRQIVNLSRKELNNGEPFADAVRAFFAWAGPNSFFCTWGSIDLTELQRNMEYYKILYLLKGPLHYFDVQKLFAIQYETMDKRRSLEYAVDYFDLQRSGEFHNALSDADYTAQVMMRIDLPVIWTYDSIDVYQNPQAKEDEIHAVYNGYTKYISREFPDKESAMIDPEVRSIRCCLCGARSRQKLRWFSVNAKNYYSTAICPNHGFIKGKIRMLHGINGGYFAVKTIKVSSEHEAQDIAAKKAAIVMKRKKHA